MTEATTDSATGDTGTDGEQQQQEQTFTQAEVDRMIKQRAERIAREKYPDYDELKAAAGLKATADERLATLERELASTRTEAIKARIAGRFNISTEPGKDGEPSDADLFLTGADEETLTRQAQRFADRVAAVKKTGNVAPREGATTTTGKGDEAMREFTRNLFAQAD